ncbi:MAG: hypothetical protein KGK00_00305 [Paracoccaceae bacterium]|nr:hypothetical protein [Paracoccaceae bacterium]
MEDDLGFSEMSETQRDVLYAIRLVADAQGRATISEIRGHMLAKTISRPSFFRALSALVDRKLIVHDGVGRTGTYLLAGSDRDLTVADNA